MKTKLLLVVLFSLLCLTSVYAEETPKVENPAEAKKAEAAKPADPTPAPAEAAPAEPVDPNRAAMEVAWSFVKKSVRVVKGLKTYTSVFYKQEYVDGEMRPEEKMALKYRTKPRAVYMKWVGKERKNQEVIWGPEINDGEIRAHKGSFPDLTVSLDPKGGMAMKGNRHPIMESGFAHSVKLIARDIQRAMKKNPLDGKFTDLGVQTVHGAKSHCFESELNKAGDPKYYGYKAHICVNLKTNLPNKIQIWDKEDGKVRLVESYSYENTKLNVPLTDEDFNHKNKNYNF